MSTEPMRIHVRDEPDVTRAILEVGRLCDRHGFRADQKSRLTTAASELARNILKYAVKGEIQIQTRESRLSVGISVVATDRGPGIPDVSKALEDHFSSGGTLGLGLPGVRRLVDEFSIESSAETGTRVSALLWK